MAKVSNEKKLEAVKGWLKENNVKYVEDYVTKAGLKIDLWLPSLFIAIHVGEDGSEFFYKKTCKWCKPFFIRESETQAFVLEKIQNCAYDQMLYMQKKLENAAKKEEGRRIAEESERRHQEKLAKKAAAKEAAKKPKRKRMRIQHFEKVEPRRRDEVQG